MTAKFLISRSYSTAILLVGCGGRCILETDGYAYLDDYPRPTRTVWSNEGQGIAQDVVTSSWYVSNAHGIFRYPVEADLAGSDYTERVGLPDGCSHLGDVDVYAGELFAPLEGCGHPKNRLYVLDRDLQTLRWAEVGQRHFAWVAVNPIDGLIYTSESDDVTTITAYSPDFVTGGKLKPVYRVELPLEHKQVQGGAFSPAGNFYLVDDDRDNIAAAGIYSYRIHGFEGELIRYIPMLGFSPHFPSYQELEGLTVWDLDSVGDKYSAVGGQIHWMLLDNDTALEGGDEASLLHVSLDDPEEL